MSKKSFFFLIYLINFFLNLNNTFAQTTENQEDIYVQLYREGRDLDNDGKHFEALDKLNYTLNYGEKIFGKEVDKLRMVYYYLGIACNNIGQYDKAIYYGNLAEQGFLKYYGKLHRNVAVSYTIIGNAYRGKQNYLEALEYYSRHLNVLVTLNEDLIRIAEVNYSIAEVLYKLNRFNEAIVIIEQNIKNAGYFDKIDYFTLLAAIYISLNDFESSKRIHLQAIDFLRNTEDSELDLTYEYISYSDLLVRMKDLSTAQIFLQKADSLLKMQNISSGEYIADLYRTQGFLYEKMEVKSIDFGVQEKNQRKRHLEASIESYKKALEALNFPVNIENISNIDSIQSVSNMDGLSVISSIAQAYSNISNLFEGINDEIFFFNLKKSLEYHEFIGDFVIRLRKEITGDENKITLTGIQESSLKEIIRVAYKAFNFSGNAYYAEIAFENAERLKSGSVFEKLMDELAKENSLIPIDTLEKETLINSKLASYTLEKYNLAKSSGSDNSQRSEVLDSLILKTKREYTEFAMSLEQNYPEYFKMKYGEQSLSIKTIQDKLKANQTLIEYTFNENDSISELYTFVINPSTVSFTKQELKDSFLLDLNRVYNFLTDKNYQFIKNKDAINFTLSANRLYNSLIEPVTEQIINNEIILIPDGKLNYIAFDALITELPDTTRNIEFNKLEYLIKRYQINYSYSANLLFAIPKNKEKGKRNVLAFAPEYNNDSILYNGKIIKLLPLPGTQKEVESISEHFETEIFKGEKASVKNFLKHYQQYEILHLAMHAILNDSLPNLSRFVFSQNPDHISKLELYTADIYNLNLKNTQLAVLSACNTGSGKIQKGEGVMSVSRGFLYAGCPSVVMTLWEAEDQSGTTIMNAFYSYLKKGNSIDKALRKSKLDYLENANSRMAHPHYWLAYISIGDNSPMYRSRDYYFLTLIILVVVGIGIEQFLKRRKRRFYKG